jgi:hypothetical protein
VPVTSAGLLGIATLSMLRSWLVLLRCSTKVNLFSISRFAIAHFLALNLPLDPSTLCIFELPSSVCESKKIGTPE